MSEPVILKLGGSVITDKSAGCRIRHDALASAAREIGRRGQVKVLVHGAGSCGHPEARQYRINEGVDRTNAGGIPVTHMAVRQLNDAVVNAIRAEGIEAIGVHPLSAWCADDGELISPDLSSVRRMIELGIMPVLHGDVVMDRIRGASIISGDRLVRHLSVGLAIRRVGLATDVPGILCNGRVLPEITSLTAGEIAGSSVNPDVTGGMKGKLAELLQLADEGTSAEVFHISRLGDFLDMKPHGGTLVRRQP